MKITAKYIPEKPVIIGYNALICVGILLTVGRWFSVVDNNFVLFNYEIHSHISNFSLSMIFYLGIAYSWLLNGMKFHLIIIFGVFLIIANFVYETLMGFMNTPDVIDAIYGTIGIAVAFVFLYVTNKYGLILNNSEGL